MVYFETDVRLLEDTGEFVEMNKYHFKVFSAEVASLQLPVLVSAEKELNSGDYLRVDKAVLTHYKPEGSESTLAIRAHSFQVIGEEDYDKKEKLIVRVRGKVVKSKNAQLKKVTVQSLDFIACSLVLMNEIRDRIYIPVVAFCQEARSIWQLGTGTAINVEARLVPRLRDTGLELNILSFEEAHKPKKFYKDGRGEKWA